MVVMFKIMFYHFINLNCFININLTIMFFEFDVTLSLVSCFIVLFTFCRVYFELIFRIVLYLLVSFVHRLIHFHFDWVFVLIECGEFMLCPLNCVFQSLLLLNFIGTTVNYFRLCLIDLDWFNGIWCVDNDIVVAGTSCCRLNNWLILHTHRFGSWLL